MIELYLQTMVTVLWMVHMWFLYLSYKIMKIRLFTRKKEGKAIDSADIQIMTGRSIYSDTHLSGERYLSANTSPSGISIFCIETAATSPTIGD